MEKDVLTMSVAELIATPEFKKNLQTLIDNVCQSRLKLANEARKRDRQLKRHPIDRLIELDIFNADNMAVEFESILNKTNHRPSAIRGNIVSIGMEAYKLTIKELAKGNPEAEKRLKNDKRNQSKRTCDKMEGLASGGKTNLPIQQ